MENEEKMIKEEKVSENNNQLFNEMLPLQNTELVSLQNTKLVPSGSNELATINYENEVHYGFNGEEFITGAVITSTDVEILVEHSMDDRLYLFYDGINPLEDKYQLVQEVRDGVLYAGIKGIEEMLSEVGNTVANFFNRLFGKNKEIPDNHPENQIISLLTPPEYLRGHGEKRIVVLVPEGMSNVEFRSASGNINISNILTGGLTGKALSGNVTLNNVSSEFMTVKSTSGEIRMDNINSRDAVVSNTSGNITVTNSGANKMSCKSVSGQVVTEYLSAGEFKASSTSGSIKSGVCSSNVTANTTSGAIKLELHGNVINSSVNSVSGSVDVNIVDETNLTLNTSSVSGRVNVSYLGLNGNVKGNYLVGTGQGRLDVKTVSGSIGVR